ncbi:MAG: hypothetical protein IT355_10600 [Gemmatimonadaceae bacterium]|nr:hypothetical protein [Gemmatimonadaceae bacterium]
MSFAVARIVVLATATLGLSACDRVFTATPTERVGYLRELVRARAISRDTLPLDACSVTRFMDGMPTWRDSLLPAERAAIVEGVAPCPAPAQPVEGRFVLTRWYRNWSGEYVIRGAIAHTEQGYRFTDGIFVGREPIQNSEYVAGIAEKGRRGVDSGSVAGAAAGDSIRRAGALADTAADSLRPAAGDTTRRATGTTTPFR